MYGVCFVTTVVFVSGLEGFVVSRNFSVPVRIESWTFFLTVKESYLSPAMLD